MSSLPPNVVGPILNTIVSQRQVSRIQDTERNVQAESAADRRRIGETTEDTVGTADNDTQINADSEGAGGQGRPFGQSAEEPENAASEQTGPTPGDPAGGTHLDIQA